jgi:hypothetical protein
MDHRGMTFGFEVEPEPKRMSKRRHGSLKLRLLDYCLSLCWLTSASGVLVSHFRRSRLKRRAALLLDRLRGHQERSPVYIPTARERLLRFITFETRTTGRDEDRPGRLLLGRFPESGLSVA